MMLCLPTSEFFFCDGRQAKGGGGVGGSISPDIQSRMGTLERFEVKKPGVNRGIM